MRTNIEINDEIIAQAMKLTSIKTKREVVDLALNELVNKAKRKKLATFWGSNIWQGDLDKMRTQ